mmetsp:Transcript_152666/g.266573  ORF Transcript_152666/g.266573 Transcript_152666/m.266573 type:complete len:88 (-) Transcript_152666:266-529(-)
MEVSWNADLNPVTNSDTDPTINPNTKHDADCTPAPDPLMPFLVPPLDSVFASSVGQKVAASPDVAPTPLTKAYRLPILTRILPGTKQ